MEERFDLFADILPTFKITKPIRLIELFAGYGSQALALKYLGVDFEHWKIAEWNYKSCYAYHQIHMGDDKTNYSEGMTKEELIDYLTEKGISSDWNKAMTREQISRVAEWELRRIYNSIKATHNLVNISQVKGKDLEIVEQDKYCYIMTYSFPCQDLSLAGLRKGMDKESDTRSGLLWEVERILKECKKLGCLPDVLLMENVTQVHGKGNYDNFKRWIKQLVRLGYESYYEDLIATDYGIPQIRNRTFMVSVKEAHYDFPKPIKLEKKLKDLLEKEVDEKYYLSEKGVNYIFNEKRQQNHWTNINPEKAIPVTAKGQNNWTGSFIAIKNATKQGYLEGEDGDGVDISARMEYHRGTVQKGLSQTISCQGGENQGVILKNEE